jgi:hypothetical protein
MGKHIQPVLQAAGTVLGAVYAPELLPGLTAGTASAVGGAVGGGAGTVIGSALTPKPAQPQIPGLLAQPVMPVPDSDTQLAQQRQKLALAQNKGRASTILTQGGLGEGTKLGA